MYVVFIFLLASFYSIFDASQGVSLSPTERDVIWANFKTKFTKTYVSASDESARRRIFNDRLSVISTHNNNPSSTYQMTVNQFTDMTVDELKAYTGVVQSKENLIGKFVGTFSAISPSLLLPKKSVNLPASVDYRNDSCMQPIKDQGECGSCWAFAAVAVVEFNNCVQTGKAVALSDQQATDCTYASSRDGCEGGLPSEAIMSIARKTFGINTQTAYPYTSGKNGLPGTCNHTRSSDGATVQLLFPLIRISSRDTNTMMSILANKGLLSVAFNVVKSFFSYKRGVYNEADCTTYILGGHAITIVGYGTDNETGLDYWICRNQWNASWGSAGYILFRRGVNLCKIESWEVVGANTGGFLASILSNIIG